MTDPGKGADNSEALKERIAELQKAERDAKGRADKAEASNKELSDRLAELEAAEDPLSLPFDEAEAGSIVERLLGISKIPMEKDVEALLWTHTLRRLGVLTSKEYEKRKARVLARALDPPPSSSSPGAGGGTPAGGPKNEKPGGGSTPSDVRSQSEK